MNTMNTPKTQINGIINGAKRTITLDSDSKYLTAKKATSHHGWAGTPMEERLRIMEKVAAENEKSMDVIVNGEPVTLLKGESTTGKTWWYKADISEELASNFVNTDGGCRAYEMHIAMDGEVIINKWVRRNERCQWRHSMDQPIDSSFVVIL